MRVPFVVATAVLIVVLGVLPGVSFGPVSAADPAADPAATAASRDCPEPAPPTEPTPRPTHRPTPDPSFARGINVSVYDRSPKLSALDAAGVAFVYARATSGTDYQDPTHLRWIRRGIAHHMAVGSYHFFDYRASGVQQARFFVRTVLAQGGFDRRLPPVLDVECFPPWGAGVRATAAREMRAFLEETFRLTGLAPMIYTGRYAWREWLGNPDGFATQRLWIACWVCGASPALPPGWASWAMWQHGAWHVPGVRRILGANVVPGGADAVAALLRRPARLVQASVDVPWATVDLAHSDGVAWQASVDGRPWTAWSPVAAAVQVPLGATLGRHEVRVRRRDAAGTVSPIDTFTVTRVEAVATLDGPR